MKYIIALILLSSCYGKKPEKTGLEGKLLPSFSILLPDSLTELNTKDIPTGQPTVFVFFGPQCPYSKAQIKDIIADENLNAIKFYLITPYPFQQMKKLYDEYNLKYSSNIIMGVDSKNFFGQYIGAAAVPYIAIYDKNKVLSKAFMGKVTPTQIKEISED